MTLTGPIAAKAALKRKKAHEHSFEQTTAQIGTLEQQINAIESANINRETLAAMQKAGEAMKQIHGKLTPEKVDETMYEPRPCFSFSFWGSLDRWLMWFNRAQLQEQNALSEEIVSAITSNQIGEPIDEDELDEELEAMQQEQLDEQMLKSGTVPVSDTIHRLPSVANGKSTSEREMPLYAIN